MARVGANPIGLGKSPAGIERVGPYSTAPSLAVLPAVEYLAQNRDYNGKAADPIDVDVAISLAFPQGSVRHAPDAGNLLHTITPLGQPDEQEKATELVKQSNPFARRLAAGDIALMSVETSSDNGQLRVRVGFRNLRNNPNKTLFLSNR